MGGGAETDRERERNMERKSAQREARGVTCVTPQRREEQRGSKGEIKRDSHKVKEKTREEEKKKIERKKRGRGSREERQEGGMPNVEWVNETGTLTCHLPPRSKLGGRAGEGGRGGGRASMNRATIESEARGARCGALGRGTNRG